MDEEGLSRERKRKSNAEEEAPATRIVIFLALKKEIATRLDGNECAVLYSFVTRVDRGLRMGKVIVELLFLIGY